MILLIQLKPKHQGRNVLEVISPGGELTKGQNVHKSPVITRVPEWWLFITRLLSTPQCPYGSEFGAIYNISD